jgi:hypothetical protein
LRESPRRSMAVPAALIVEAAEKNLDNSFLQNDNAGR